MKRSGLVGALMRGAGHICLGLAVALALSERALAAAGFAATGWLLLNVALAGGSRAAAEHGLVGDDAGREPGPGGLPQVTVRDVMTEGASAVPADATLTWFVDEVVWSTRHTVYPVVSGDGAPLGLVNLRSVARIPHDAWDGVMVGELMLPLTEVAVLAPDLPLDDALEALCGGTRQALVVDGGRLVGVLSPTDVVSSLVAARNGASWDEPRREVAEVVE